MMMFIFRLGLWGFLGLLALPSFVSIDAPDPGGSPAVAEQPVGKTELMFSAFAFANGVRSDLSELCERNETVCEHGATIGAATLQRAKQGLSIATQIVADKTTAPDNS